MKIGIITEYYYPSLGGITEHVHHFAVEAKKLGHEVAIITGNAGDDPFTDTKEVEIIRLGRSVPIYSNGSIARATFATNIGRKIKEIFSSENFDIIHIHPPFVPTLPMMAQRYSNTTTFATFHTQFDSNIFLNIFRGLAQRAMDCLHGKIAVSKLCVESFEKYVDCKARIIPNGVDTANFNCNAERIKKFTDGKLNIFFLSRLEPRNGLEYLIEAFAIVRGKRDNCRLIIGGDGPLKNHFMSLVPANLKEDVHFIGRINGVRPNYYATADIFCFPTTRASFGITILEAMASGKPVAAFSLPAYESIMTSGEHGILCGKPDSQALAWAIEEMLGNEDRRREMGRRARRRAEDFAWDKITAEIIDYYEHVKAVN